MEEDNGLNSYMLEAFVVVAAPHVVSLNSGYPPFPSISGGVGRALVALL